MTIALKSLTERFCNMLVESLICADFALSSRVKFFNQLSEILLGNCCADFALQ